MKHLHCAFCDTLTKTKLVSREKIRNGKGYSLQMKAEVCPNCGEQYYDGERLAEFEKMVKSRHIKEAA